MKPDEILQARDGADVQQVQTNPPRRILVVDDDEPMRCLNVETLLYSGYLVEAVGDGLAAWECLQNGNKYDLMITDNNMPRMSGAVLVKKIHAAGLDMPIIMATGTTPDEKFQKPPVVLLKPYAFGDLIKAVRAALKQDTLPT